eukprot:jgi/Psemu1/295679/fgenesh1_pm.80_\
MTVDLGRKARIHNPLHPERSRVINQAPTMMQSNTDRHDDPEHGGDPQEVTSIPPNAAFWRSRVSEVQFPLVMVVGASVVLLIAVCTWETGMTFEGYKISIPSVSLSLAGIGLMLTAYREDLYAVYGNRLAHALFLWNFAGACFLTFASPFTETGNGYFAAWACVATSAMAMGLTVDALRNRIKGLGSLMGLCACAAIVVIALIDHMGYRTTVKFGFLAVFAVLWFVLAFLVTFRGPFVTTGNGYFASWCGAMCACSTAFHARNEVKGLSIGQVVDGSEAENQNNAPPTGLSATIT